MFWRDWEVAVSEAAGPWYTSRLPLNYHDESDSMADFIEGKRPVIEALRTHVPLKYILMADNLSQGDSLVRDIQRKAKNLDVPIKKVSKKKLDEVSERGSHQGVMAEAAPFNYVNTAREVVDLITSTKSKTSR